MLSKNHYLYFVHKGFDSQSELSFKFCLPNVTFRDLYHVVNIYAMKYSINILETALILTNRLDITLCRI